MKVVTVATHSFGYFPILLESCKRNHIDLTVLGFNEKWTNYQFKFDKIRKFLESVQDENEWIIYIDAFDVIVLEDVSLLKQRLEVIDREDIDFVVSLDKYKTLLETYFSKFTFGTFGNISINAGMFAVKKQRFLDMITCVEKKFDKNEYDDQIAMVWYLNNAKNQNKILVDTKNTLFYNGYIQHLVPNKTIFSDGTIYSVESRSLIQPIFLHFPCNQDFKYICSFLNYDIPEQTLKDTSVIKKIEYQKTRSIIFKNFVSVVILACLFLLILVFIGFWIRDEREYGFKKCINTKK